MDISHIVCLHLCMALILITGQGAGVVMVMSAVSSVAEVDSVDSRPY